MQVDRPTRALLDLLSCGDSGVPPSSVALTQDEWQTLARAAVRHGVAPLVHACLGKVEAGTPGVPPPVLAAMRSYYFRTGLENLRLYGRLAPVLRACAAHGIETIVLKGAFLAQTVYPDRALRSMGDADLLVHRADLERVDRLLRGLGWQQPVADDPAAPRQSRGHQLQTFVADSVHVEIHWNIEDDDSPFTVDVDGLWQRAQPVQIAGAATFALAPEDLLLHLCLHASYNHGWLQFEAGLRPLKDISATLRHFAHRIDWDTFNGRALEWKVQRCAWLTLTLARYLLGTDVPGHAIDALAAEPADGSVIDTAVELVLTNYYADVTRTLPALGPRWLTKRRQHLSAADRLRHNLLPGIDALGAAYPSLPAAVPLRYLAHWTDLAGDAVRISLAREGRRLSACERTRMNLAGWLEARGTQGWRGFSSAGRARR